MYPFQWPESYAMHEERNQRHVEQSESVKSDFNEKFIQMIIHPTEYVISELNIASLIFALKSVNEKDARIVQIAFKQGENESEFMFLSPDEETTIHMYNYVQLMITIASQCIIELEETANENVTPNAGKQKNRKEIALEKWRGLEKSLEAPKKRLHDEISTLLANKYHITSGLFWMPREVKFVDSNACEMVEF